jgi:hypothetical protein
MLVPDPLVRNAFAPVPLIAMELTGLDWPAVEGFNSRIVKVVLLVADESAEKTARFPAVKAHCPREAASQYAPASAMPPRTLCIELDLRFIGWGNNQRCWF